MMTFTQICMLMTGQRIMPPGLRAAAFEALAKIPRVRLDHDEVDVLGRHGIGVSYPEVAFTFVFDSRTYDCLGLRTKGSGAQRGSWPVASGRLVLRDEEPGEGGCGGRHRPAPLNPVTGLASAGRPTADRDRETLAPASGRPDIRSPREDTRPTLGSWTSPW